MSRTMTVYAPVEQQPKLGRRRDELTEVKILVNFICVDFLYSASPFYSFFLSTLFKYCPQIYVVVEMKFFVLT